MNIKQTGLQLSCQLKNDQKC